MTGRSLFKVIGCRTLRLENSYTF